MDHLTLNDRFTLHSQDYLLKTIDDTEVRQILLRLFRQGEIIHTAPLPYNGNLTAGERQQLAIQHHQRHKEELAKLFQLQNRREPGVPQDPGTLFLLAAGLMKYGLMQEAINNLAAIVTGSTSPPQVHSALGQAYLKMKNYPAAVEQFRQVLALNVNYADQHYYCGLCEYYLQRCEPAARALSRAIKINPHYGEAYFYLGLALLLNVKLGQEYDLAVRLHERARQIFQRAVAILPVLRGEVFDRGLQLVRQENFEEAYGVLAPLAEKLVDEKPDVVNYQFHLLVLADADQIQTTQVWQEIKRLEELLQRFPGYADIAYELGFAYAVLGLRVTAQSLAHFEHALEVNPEYKNAQKGLKLIKNDQRGFRNLLHALVALQK